MIHVHCKLQHRTQNKNTYNSVRFVKLLNVSDLIDVIILEFKSLQDKINTSVLQTLIRYT
jgi:hypothetical protein